MASSKTDNDLFKEGLRRCVEKLPLKDGSELDPFSGCPNNHNGACVDRSNGLFNIRGVNHLESRVPEEGKSPRQAAIGKQQGGVPKQHRRSRKGNIKMFSTNERDFKALVSQHTCMPSLADKALVSKHTCMPSLSAPDIMQHTSPLSPQSNSSNLTCRSVSQPACGYLSQPGSPETPTSLQFRMGFNSPPMSPISKPRLSSIFPSPSTGKDVCVNKSMQATPSLSTFESYKHASHTYLNSSSDLYPHRGSTGDGVLQAPCLNDAVDGNQVDWPQGTCILELPMMEKYLMKDT